MYCAVSSSPRLGVSRPIIESCAMTWIRRATSASVMLAAPRATGAADCIWAEAGAAMAASARIDRICFMVPSLKVKSKSAGDQQCYAPRRREVSGLPSPQLGLAGALRWGRLPGRLGASWLLAGLRPALGALGGGALADRRPLFARPGCRLGLPRPLPALGRLRLGGRRQRTDPG